MDFSITRGFYREEARADLDTGTYECLYTLGDQQETQIVTINVNRKFLYPKKMENDRVYWVQSGKVFNVCVHLISVLRHSLF